MNIFENEFLKNVDSYFFTSLSAIDFSYVILYFIIILFIVFLFIAHVHVKRE